RDVHLSAELLLLRPAGGSPLQPRPDRQPGDAKQGRVRRRAGRRPPDLRRRRPGDDRLRRASAAPGRMPLLRAAASVPRRSARDSHLAPGGPHDGGDAAGRATLPARVLPAATDAVVGRLLHRRLAGPHLSPVGAARGAARLRRQRMNLGATLVLYLLPGVGAAARAGRGLWPALGAVLLTPLFLPGLLARTESADRHTPPADHHPAVA